MKINQQMHTIKTGNEIIKNKNTNNIFDTDFISKFKEFSANSDNYLNELMQKIDNDGARLTKSINIVDLKCFKKAVSQFLKYLINSSLHFEKENVFDSRGRQQIFSMVKKVNQKLDELVASVMENQKDNIKVLKLIDDIRGMLIDITT